jgi:hypothetical protein
MISGVDADLQETLRDQIMRNLSEDNEREGVGDRQLSRE